jgi:phi LC3 family holin
MNFILRLKNKTCLVALISSIIAFVYQILGIFEVVPVISENEITQICGIVINLLVTLGVIVDPTTQGIADSKQALEYTEPKKGE